jgi:hypothetical protein
MRKLPPLKMPLPRKPASAAPTTDVSGVAHQKPAPVDYTSRPKLSGRPPKDPILRAARDAAVAAKKAAELDEKADKSLDRAAKKTEQIAAKLHKNLEDGISHRPTKIARPDRTEQEIIAEYNEAIQLTGELAAVAAKGEIRSIVLTGGPGIGKSYTTESTLEKLSDTRGTNWELLNVRVSPPKLFGALSRLRHPKDVLVLDDADGLLDDEKSLNLLKAGMDSKPVRKVSWGAEAPWMKRDGLEPSFPYEGSIIFITNLPIGQLQDRMGKNTAHIAAVFDRAHVLDLEMRDRWSRFICTKFMVTKRHIVMANTGVGKAEEATIWNWIMENRFHIQNISLRTAIKVALNFKSWPNHWESVSKKTIGYDKDWYFPDEGKFSV